MSYRSVFKPGLFEGQTVIVTGGGSGIGRCTAHELVHGDYRTGNFLEQGGRITAILDWELVHLGDPHEDLG